ncbi:condensation domain-containing protein, partial [Salinactinospora qingdaonensis]|uniref:condensation domain-containing protein n=1 Tax=Salinactinospora qingdaonensis TaxID=702744 RepID=UPI0031EC1EDC
RLLLVAHHLVVDVVSWRVLLEDIDTLTRQLRQGQTLELPPKSSSWQQWAHRLHQEAHSDTTAQELAYWNEQTEPAGTLPTEGSAEDNTVAASRVYEAVLETEQGRALLHDLPTTFNTRINDVLLTAVASAVGSWTHDSHVRLDLEGHGREDLFDDIDVSRTVGWFTTISPVRLPVPSPTALGEGLKQVKELLR